MNSSKTTLTEAEAAQQLAEMTPQDVIDMHNYIESLEDGSNLPEAPASVNVKVNIRGLDVMYTMRGWDDDRLLDRLDKVVDKILFRDARASVGQTVETQPAAARPTTAQSSGEVRLTSAVDPSVINGSNVESFEVTSLTYQFRGKTPSLNARGGVWVKYGWIAWPEIIPESVDYGQWEIGVERHEIPPEMRFAFVDKERKKIVAFAASI